MGREITTHKMEGKEQTERRDNEYTWMLEGEHSSVLSWMLGLSFEGQNWCWYLRFCSCCIPGLGGFDTCWEVAVRLVFILFCAARLMEGKEKKGFPRHSSDGD